MKYRTNRKRSAVLSKLPHGLAGGALRKLLVATFALASLANGALAQESKRDAFFWLGQINKASAVINTDEGLLDKSMAPRIARGLQSVLKAGDARMANGQVWSSLSSPCSLMPLVWKPLFCMPGAQARICWLRCALPYRGTICCA